VLAAEQITTALFQAQSQGGLLARFRQGAPPRVRPARTASETLSPRTEPQARLAFGIDVLRETVRRLLGGI
jgi:hypothetical protein